MEETKINAQPIDSKIPEGPIAEKWTNYKAHQKLVNPANKRKLDIIVVGTGLAGASAAATLGEMGFNVLNFCIQDSPRRAHSIAAQGGINAAKNYQNDGDSVYRLFYDTVVLVVLGCIDTTLSGNGVRAAGRILDAEVQYVKAHLAQRGGCRCTCQTGTHDDDVEFALIGGVDEFLVSLIVGPFLSDGSLGNLGIDGLSVNFGFFHLCYKF